MWDEALAAPFWNGPPVWLHTDLFPSNLLVRDGTLASRRRSSHAYYPHESEYGRDATALPSAALSE